MKAVLAGLVLGLCGSPVSARAPVVVVLDPGHGGSASGMVGPRGTREADLNLAVARELSNRLTARGWTVLMTRTADGDLLAQPAPLKDELRSRATLADAAGAVLFVSLHHNATPETGTPAEQLRRNRSEAYAKMEDPASWDFGIRLLDAFHPLTHSSRDRLFPSNFSVLRNNARPAVLGEPFYLSIDLFERYAAHPDFARLEAHLYERAITSWLASPRPCLSLLSPYPGETVTSADLVVEGRVSSCLSDPGEDYSASPPDELARVDLSLDGVGEPTRVEWPASGRFRAVFERVANGTHSIRALAIDHAGRVSLASARTVVVSGAPSVLEAVALPGADSPPGCPRIVRATVRDRAGRAVADGTTVRLEGAGPPRTAVTTGGATAFVLAPGATPGVRVTAGVAASVWRGGEPVAKTLWTWGTALDRESGHPVPGLTLAGVRASAVATASGHFVASRAATTTLRFAGEGYVPVERSAEGASAGTSVRMQRVLWGALRGRAISVDLSDAGPSPALARSLDAILRAAGARPEIRRESDVTGRVLSSNRRVDDLYLCVRLGGERDAVSHYAASPRGKTLAQSIAARLGHGAPVRESGEYVTSNTGGTAVIVNLGRALARAPQHAALRVVEGLAAGVAGAAAVRGAEERRPDREVLPLGEGLRLMASGRIEWSDRKLARPPGAGER